MDANPMGVTTNVVTKNRARRISKIDTITKAITSVVN